LKLYSYTLGLYQLENTIILIDVLFSCTITLFCKTMTCTFSTYVSKNLLKHILKHAIFQYYEMNSTNFWLLIIDLNNIYEFNILRYILCIFSKKVASVFDWHTVQCSCLLIKIILLLSSYCWAWSLHLTLSMIIYKNISIGKQLKHKGKLH